MKDVFALREMYVSHMVFEMQILNNTDS